MKTKFLKILHFWQFQKLVFDYHNTILHYSDHICTMFILYGVENQTIFWPREEGYQRRGGGKKSKAAQLYTPLNTRFLSWNFLDAVKPIIKILFSVTFFAQLFFSVLIWTYYEEEKKEYRLYEIYLCVSLKFTEN